MKLFVFLTFLAGQALYSQGSPGPIPLQGDYPLGLNTNSVMPHAIWLDQNNTTLDQQVQAVTADALNLHITILPPLPSGTGPNQYTGSGTPFVSPSPGPTSSSSTTSSGGGSSSGFPGSDGDIVLWRTSDPTQLPNIINQGGVSYMDGTCQEEAKEMSLPGHLNAKAIVERSATERCHNTFIGIGQILTSTAVYTVQENGADLNYTQIYGYNFEQMFQANPPGVIGQIQVAIPVAMATPGIYSWTGCASNSALPTTHPTENCNGWTSNSGTFSVTYTDTDTGKYWERGLAPLLESCDNSNLAFRWYCGIAWNSGGSSSTSSASSSGAIQVGDHLVWHSSSTQLSNIVNGGGQSFVDQQCQDEAGQMGWPNHQTARALVNADGAGCIRGLMGGANNWTTTPTPGQFEIIKSGSFSNLFSLGGPNPGPRNKNGIFNGIERITGCENNGTPSPQNCANFTTLSGASNFYHGSGSGPNWLYSGAASCNDTLVRPFYCALAWGTGSSSTSTTSTSTSNGFPGGPDDHVVWRGGAVQWVAGFIAQGGPPYMDGRCRALAQAEGWANWANAKVIINTDGNTSCASHFSGGSHVYMPVRSGPNVIFETVHQGSIESMFANGGPADRHIDRQASGHVHNHELITGCDNYGNPTTEHCNAWTDTTINYGYSYGPSNGLPSSSWLNKGTGTCASQAPGPMSVGYLCGMRWGP